MKDHRSSKVSPLKRVERPVALGGRVYQALRSGIREGKIPPGRPLQEVQLAAQLGVSRTPVREALARLANEGLVASDGRSFTVPSLALSDIEDIYELRLLIEPAALRHVARRASDPAVRAPITEALAASIAAHRAGDAEAFMEANARFRTGWLSFVPNWRLVYVVQLYADHVHNVRALTLGDARVRTVVLRGLKRIAAALAAGDGEAAAAAMRDHLTEAKVAFIEAIGLRRDPAGRAGTRAHPGRAAAALR
jgi:DNA-binding GntR family transcriptional regulator